VVPRVSVDVAENFPSIGIRSPDRPASSESVYRLCYFGSLVCSNKYGKAVFLRGGKKRQITSVSMWMIEN
jgi:hypothetical protein